MASLCLCNISQNIHTGKSVTKIENQRLYETDVYTIVNEESQTCIFGHRLLSV